ncbi:MAG: alpha/beta fold hydrolase [Chitinophaga sp.]|uniref:alpha/beta hydrolase family protein n=1 Tax=Chitinophaga sp. TaxID=1869181 RepID=UPI001B024796|nr:alpha/beta fold hydrolase [Chitinophaga sp.]MBO9730220.1 alpha/beta fold hydrolase [Chitinophaga sp.]
MRKKLSAFLLLAVIAMQAHSQLRHTIWDVPAIYQTPTYEVISNDSVKGILYQGLPYHDGPQQVFAWYATPGTLSGNKSLDHDLPAVVLVHGGGGIAFKEWAILWAKKGYAAIAMDLRGNGPNRQHLAHGFVEPDNKTPYFTITPTLSDQWMYQAVANVILANNLLRSFPEVDSNRIALTGISWGGILSCLIAGIDNRYKAVVPVYGCGYLFYNTAMLKDLDQLSPADKQTWIQQYDPSQYIRHAKMPMLFINGTNDSHFYLDSYKKTYEQVKNAQLSIKPRLRHSHHDGWQSEEIFAFINSYLNHTTPLPRITKTCITQTGITAKVISAEPLAAAYLHYTTDTATLLKDKIWEVMPVNIKGERVEAAVPPVGTLVWYLSVTDKRGMQVSGDIIFKR